MWMQWEDRTVMQTHEDTVRLLKWELLSATLMWMRRAQGAAWHQTQAAAMGSSRLREQNKHSKPTKQTHTSLKLELVSKGSYQYDPVNHNSSRDSQGPVNWLIGYKDQNQRIWTCTSHCQIHIGVTRVVNAKSRMSIALIVGNYVYIIVAVVIRNAAVSCLRIASVSRGSHTNTSTLCDVAAANNSCRMIKLGYKYLSISLQKTYVTLSNLLQ